MNIFALHEDTKICAQYHCDKHVVRQILECGLLLSTAHHLSGSGRPWLYKPTHENHPCAIWTRSLTGNYEWLYQLFRDLNLEYSHRYDKYHLTWRKLYTYLKNIPDIPVGERTTFSVATVDHTSTGEPSSIAIDHYRKYYNEYKRHILHWKKRDTPDWIKP